MKKLIYTTAILALGLSACSKDESFNTPETVASVKSDALVYHVSIPASIGGDADSRAVSYDSGTEAMNAMFLTTDNVFVYNKTKGLFAMNSSTEMMPLHPDCSGMAANLTGDLTFYSSGSYNEVEVNDNLLLCYNATSSDASFSYGSQTGTLEGLSSYDYATTEVTVTGLAGEGTAESPYTIETGSATFKNEQSMFQFTFTGLPTDVAVQKLTVHSAAGKLVGSYCPADDNSAYSDLEITLPTGGGANVVYAALRFDPLGEYETDEITYTVVGTDNKTYYAMKTSPQAGFELGKFYTATIALTATVGGSDETIDLSNVSSNIVVADGSTLSGTLDGATHRYQIMIAHGANVTLSGATITGLDWVDGQPNFAGITCLGDATITLADDKVNEVNGGPAYAGIFVPEGSTLTIRGGTDGTGELAATGWNAAGIGSNKYNACGNISIEGGNITATGGENAAGIGSGLRVSCGNITISGGTVTATGGDFAAGIGSGEFGSCGDITISGGTVTATDGGYASGIGSGFESSCGDITISGGTVTATGGNQAAGIGCGERGSCGYITISSGTVTATGGCDAAGIGSGESGKFAGITITRDILRITATAGSSSAWPIGKGNSDQSGDEVQVVINDQTVDDRSWDGGGLSNLKLEKSDDGNTWTLTKKLYH